MIERRCVKIYEIQNIVDDTNCCKPNECAAIAESYITYRTQRDLKCSKQQISTSIGKLLNKDQVLPSMKNANKYAFSHST